MGYFRRRLGKVKIFNGNIGNLETSQLKNDLKQLLLGVDNSILLICMNANNKKIISKLYNSSRVSIITFNDLTNEIIKKNLQNVKYSRISDFLAIQIINTKMQEKFIGNKVMKNLCKSDYFARELYNLFGLFKVNNVTCDDLLKVLVEINISDEDKHRFELVVDTYKAYQEELEQNYFMDYKDIVIKCFEFLKENPSLQALYLQKYSHILVENAQNLSALQLELIKLLADDDKILLYGDKNAQIQTFMGANAFYPEVSDYSKNIKNIDIFKRALFLKGEVLDAQKSESIEYRECADLHEEIEFIAKDIIEKVYNGSSYKDFAILLRDNSLKNTICELLKQYEIPINLENYNEYFQQFKANFISILNLCEILENLNINKFTIEDFCLLNPKSKVDFNLYVQQFNLVFLNLLNNEIENKFLLGYIEKINEYSAQKNLLFTIFENKKLFSETEQESFKNIVCEIAFNYEKYKQNDYVAIITNLVKKLNISEKIYNIFVAKFLTSVVEVCNLDKNILNKKTKIQTILKILEATLEEVESKKDGVNILTFMNSADLQFSYVYIPSLVENYFPKKIKSTYFISDDANDKISAKLKCINPNFDKIILSQHEEVKKEENLLYVALLTAKEKVFLLTHKYEQKKIVQASSFFEQLKFADRNNFIELNENSNIVDEIDRECFDKNIEQKDKDFVLDKEKSLKLSASAISLFLNCPLRFYYKRLLGLKEESSYAASYGTIVHSVFEVLFEKYLSEFSKAKTLELVQVIFNAKNDIQNALKVGFSEDVVASVNLLSNLEVDEMYRKIVDAVEDLDARNFFAQSFESAECETSFSFELDEIQNVKFIGKIDAILESSDRSIIVDYKTGKDKKKVSYLFSDDGVNFINGKKQFSKKCINEYDYQIPLYYFAALNSKELEKYRNITHLGYQYVRPVSKGKNNNGSISDFIDVSSVNMYKDKIISNLKEHVVDKLHEVKEFLPEANMQNCNYCGFKEICSGVNGDSDE